MGPRPFPEEKNILQQQLTSEFSSYENITERIVPQRPKIDSLYTAKGMEAVSLALRKYQIEIIGQLYYIYYLYGIDVATSFLVNILLPDYENLCGEILDNIKFTDGLNSK